MLMTYCFEEDFLNIKQKQPFSDFQAAFTCPYFYLRGT